MYNDLIFLNFHLFNFISHRARASAAGTAQAPAVAGTGSDGSQKLTTPSGLRTRGKKPST